MHRYEQSLHQHGCMSTTRLTLGNTVRKGASAELDQAVQESLKSLNLLHGGVADKPTGKYSGGMKRRLSVAISLIGSPKV
ncbi:hypothetical protein YC2023_057134 [Brassica napus]